MKKILIYSLVLCFCTLWGCQEASESTGITNEKTLFLLTDGGERIQGVTDYICEKMNAKVINLMGTDGQVLLEEGNINNRILIVGTEKAPEEFQQYAGKYLPFILEETQKISLFYIGSPEEEEEYKKILEEYIPHGTVLPIISIDKKEIADGTVSVGQKDTPALSEELRGRLNGWLTSVYTY